MAQPHLSLTALTILLTGGAAFFYGAFVLYGAWIDGRRQDVRKQGHHPVTDATGQVHAREEEDNDVHKRS